MGHLSSFRKFYAAAMRRIKSSGLKPSHSDCSYAALTGRSSTSDSERRCEQAEGQRDGEEYDFQDAVDGDADDAEREQDQPDEGISDQC
jgi:hypothetical protein